MGYYYLAKKIEIPRAQVAKYKVVLGIPTRSTIVIDATDETAQAQAP